MGQFLRTNGDYNIKTVEEGTITLDTGPGVGTVKVTGNLVVEGTSVTVSTTNLDVEDNVILLNKGETGAGVTLRYSGIEVDRGSLDNVTFVWDENDLAWELKTGTTYTNSRLRLSEILTNSTTDGGDLLLIGTGAGVVKVGNRGATPYEDLVTDNNDVPNKRYVDRAIQDQPTFQVVSNDSRVIVSDKDTVGSLAYLFATTGFTTTEASSAISMVVDGDLSAQFYNNRIELGNLEVGGGPLRNEITSKNGITNENIYIRTQGTGKLTTNYALELEQIAVTPAYVANSTIIYGADPGVGTSGVWFVNDSAEVAKRSGELISKNKALVFSMLF